nr:ABC transporter permease [Chloroflexia bacterium]
MATTEEAAAGGEKRSIDVVDLFSRFAPLIFLLLLVAVMSILEPGFRTERNLFNVLRQVSIIGILAIGMTFVILTAGIDLSVGSMLAFAGIVCASVAKGTRDLLVGGVTDPGGGRVLLAALAAIGLGMAIGAFQGTLIA